MSLRCIICTGALGPVRHVDLWIGRVSENTGWGRRATRYLGGALHQFVSESLNGTRQEEETRGMYGITDGMRFQFEGHIVRSRVL